MSPGFADADCGVTDKENGTGLIAVVGGIDVWEGAWVDEGNDIVTPCIVPDGAGKVTVTVGVIRTGTGVTTIVLFGAGWLLPGTGVAC